MGRRIASGASWSIVQGTLTQGAVLVSTVLIARIFGRAGFGRYAIFQTTLSVAATLFAAGIGLTATKFVAEARASKDAVERLARFSLRFSLAAGLISGSLLFLASPVLAAHILNAKELVEPLRVGAISLVFTAIAAAQTGVISGHEDFKLLARVGFFKSIATVVLTVFGAKSAGLLGAAYGTLAAQVTGCALNHVCVRRLGPFRWRGAALGARDIRRVFFDYCVPAMLSGLFVPLAAWLASTIIINNPGGYAELGTFNAANQWFTGMTAVSGLAGQALMPILAERMGTNNYKQTAEAVWFATKANLVAAIPTVIFGCVCANVIMSLYGPEFSGRGIVLAIAFITGGICAVQSAGGPFVAAAGHMWLGAAMNLGWGAAFVLMTYLLSQYGAIGMASGRLIAYILNGLGLAHYLRVVYRTRSSNANVT